MPIRHAAFLLPTLVLLLLGCGPRVSKLSGKVTYRGKPLEYGQVTFQADKGGDILKAEIQPDGSYTLDKAPHGSLRVAVFQMDKDYKSPAVLRKEYEAKGEKFPVELMNAQPKSLIPDKYSNVETSGLTVAVSASLTPLDLTLVDD